MRVKILIIFVIAILNLISLSYSANFIIVNTKDWTLAYNAMQISSFLNSKCIVIYNEQQAQREIKIISAQDNVILFQSKEKQVPDLEIQLKAKGINYKKVDKLSLLDYIDSLYKNKTIKGFVIVNEKYPTTALLSIPFVYNFKYAVIFMNEDNKEEISNFIKDKNCIAVGITKDKLIESVKCEYKFINNTKYDLSIELSNFFIEKKNVSQVTVASGLFFETGMFTSNTPILLFGINLVPKRIERYIASNKKIKICILDGPELMNLYRDFKRRLENEYKVNKTFLVRIGKTGAESGLIEALDTFLLPVKEVNVSIINIIYNVFTKELQFTLRENNGVKTFILSSIIAKDSQGNTKELIENTSFELLPYELLTRSYKLGLNNIVEGKLILFIGETPEDFYKKLEVDLSKIRSISVEDKSDIDIKKVIYFKPKKAFIVIVKNKKESIVYVSGRINNFNLGEERITIPASSVIKINGNKESGLIFPLEVKEEQFTLNKKLNITLYYGMNPELLVKTKNLLVEYEIVSYDIKKIGMYVSVIAVLVVIIILMIRRKKKKKLIELLES